VDRDRRGAAADGDARPLLLFSHGYTNVPSASTALLDDLAAAAIARWLSIASCRLRGVS
jgi:hypothetical protein